MLDVFGVMSVTTHYFTLAIVVVIALSAIMAI